MSLPVARADGPSSPGRTPRLSPKRIDAIDILRGMALIGMLAVHSLVIFNDDGTPTFVTQTAAGRSFATFAVLAGVSLALMTGARRPVVGAKLRSRQAGLAARALYIAVVGTIAGYLVTAMEVQFSVVLVYYGVMFLVALPFLRLSSRVLAGLAIAWALVAPPIIYELRPRLERTWSEQATLLDLFERPVSFVSEIFVTGSYPVLALMVFAFAGLIIGRLDLRSRVVAIRLTVVGLTMAVVSWLAASVLLFRFGGQDAIYETVPDYGLPHDVTPTTVLWFAQGNSETPWELAQRVGHSNSTFDLVHSIGVVAAILGILLLATRHATLLRVLEPLAAAGSMPLTIYTLAGVLVGCVALRAAPLLVVLLHHGRDAADVRHRLAALPRPRTPRAGRVVLRPRCVARRAATRRLIPPHTLNAATFVSTSRQASARSHPRPSRAGLSTSRRPRGSSWPK
jgi:uncharacterized membrane protein